MLQETVRIYPRLYSTWRSYQKGKWASISPQYWYRLVRLLTSQRYPWLLRLLPRTREKCLSLWSFSPLSAVMFYEAPLWQTANAPQFSFSQRWNIALSRCFPPEYSRFRVGMTLSRPSTLHNFIAWVFEGFADLHQHRISTVDATRSKSCRFRHWACG